MKYNQLGHTDIKVSEICLGTMTWGSQNTEAQAHQQLDYAIDEGVNFIDTAEMYPTTPRLNETTGRTEEILGTWLQNNPKRDAIIVATKITGEGNKDIRQGERVNGKNLRAALEGSLKRLQTDYIDLYQLHWPNRGSYHFRKYWTYDPSNQSPDGMDDEIIDILSEVAKLQVEGKLRHFGVSNETAWGVMKYLELSTKHNLPRPVSIQNEYSLICRIFDLDLSEVCTFENIGLMAYSPLAAGLLSGKYIDGRIAEGTRRNMQPNLNGRATALSEKVTGLYASLAEKHNLSLAQLALAFTLQRPFMMSTIIGATNMEQLNENIAAKDVILSEELLKEIQVIYRDYPQPM